MASNNRTSNIVRPITIFRQFSWSKFNFHDIIGSDVVYSANFFTGQVGQCLEQSISIDALEPNGEGGDDQSHVGANLFGGLWSGICGTANTVGSSGSTTEGQRIVGGFETMEHQYPWMVSSQLLMKEAFLISNMYICVGFYFTRMW